MKLTHSDIKAWNSSAHFHVRHSLIAVLTMWFTMVSVMLERTQRSFKHPLGQVILMCLRKLKTSCWWVLSSFEISVRIVILFLNESKAEIQ